MSNEMDEALMPEWARGRANGQYVVGAQLPTRDGRRVGNAHIYATEIASWDSEVTLYLVITDVGTKLKYTASELEELFYPPVWVSNVKELLRKFDHPTPEY